MFQKPRFFLFVLIAAVTVALVLPAAAQVRSVYVTTQRFDSGLMVWSADNGTIYVLADTGEAQVFPLTAYTSLPDNPIFGDPPGRLRPIFGFGKVWGHHRTVRDRLGWPVLPEIGFDTTILVQNATIFITELDGSVIQINSSGTWTRSSAPPTPPPTPANCPYPFFVGQPVEDICPGAPITTTAAYQPYERGFMIWLADAGDIWVFLNAAPQLGGAGRWLHFAESAYRGFADAVPQTPPPGKVQPVSGFGRVWYNLTGYTGQPISAELGWATAPESGYTATRQAWGRTSHSHVYLSLPDGRVLDAYQGLAGIAWGWVQ